MNLNKLILMLKKNLKIYENIENLTESFEEQKKSTDNELEIIKQNINHSLDMNNYILRIVKRIQELDEYILKRSEKIQELDEYILKRSEKIQEYAMKTSRAANENIWSNVFHDTIWDSKWLLNKKFSPGRWAVGYQYLYVLYRILESVQPQSILELGLGQSTQMMTQYAEYAEDCRHYIVEHDPAWIEFYKKNNVISDFSTIVQLDLCKKQVKQDEDVTGYKRFSETFLGKKFDLISIDAPFGSPCYIYARADILELLPQCLKKSFVIILDDYNRTGEQNTVKLLKEKLDDEKIMYCEGVYSGNKDIFVITSMDYKFLVSL